MSGHAEGVAIKTSVPAIKKPQICGKVLNMVPIN